MSYLKLFVGLLLINIPYVTVSYKLIISISQPCSLSVAFLRMMRQRGDFLISHEPGVCAWRMFDNPEKISSDEYPYEPKTFSDVEKLIKSLIERNNVFVKEESYAAYQYLYNGDIIKSPYTYVVFLIRNPHHVLLSIYSKIKKEVPGRTMCVVDYQNMWHLFEHITSVNMHQPLIISAEDLMKDPFRIVKQFCDYTDITFKEESLQWEDLSSNFIGSRTWYDTPFARFDAIWHGNALRSTCFMQRESSYALDGNGNPTFEEIENIEVRRSYLKLYEEMMPYYTLFLDQYRIQQSVYK